MWPPFSCKMLRSRHRWTLLNQGLFPAIRGICGHHAWILQQDGAPSHRAVNTTDFLEKESVQFIEPSLWLPNSPDLNIVDTSYGVLYNSACTNKRIVTLHI